MLLFFFTFGRPWNLVEHSDQQNRETSFADEELCFFFLLTKNKIGLRGATVKFSQLGEKYERRNHCRALAPMTIALIYEIHLQHSVEWHQKWGDRRPRQPTAGPFVRRYDGWILKWPFFRPSFVHSFRLVVLVECCGSESSSESVERPNQAAESGENP